MENPTEKADSFHVEDGIGPTKETAEVTFVPDPEKERRLVRKLDRTVLPWIMLLYLLSYIDRQVLNPTRNSLPTKT